MSQDVASGIFPHLDTMHGSAVTGTTIVGTYSAIEPGPTTFINVFPSSVISSLEASLTDRFDDYNYYTA